MGRWREICGQPGPMWTKPARPGPGGAFLSVGWAMLPGPTGRIV